MSVFSFSPYLPIVYGTTVPKEWRVFFLGDKFRDSVTGPDEASNSGRWIDWTSTRLFAVWHEATNPVQLRIAHSDDDGETWTHELGTYYNAPDNPTWHVPSAFGTHSPMVAFSSGRAAVYAHCLRLWEDLLGDLANEDTRRLHRAVWRPTTPHWSLRRFYDAGAGWDVWAFPARAQDHSRYGLLIREVPTDVSDRHQILKYNDLDENGDFPNTPVGSNPSGIETVYDFVGSGNDDIRRFVLTFAGDQPKAIWREVVSDASKVYYKQRTTSGWPAAAVEVTDPQAVEVYLVDEQWQVALDGNTLYGATRLTAESPEGVEGFKFRERQGTDAWTSMPLIDMRGTRDAPSSDLADSPAAWVVGGIHETDYFYHSVAHWIKNGRFMFVFMMTGHNHGARESQGATPALDGEAYIGNPGISDKLYSPEQEWLLRLDLGRSGRRFR